MLGDGDAFGVGEALVDDIADTDAVDEETMSELLDEREVEVALDETTPDIIGEMGVSVVLKKGVVKEAVAVEDVLKGRDDSNVLDEERNISDELTEETGDSDVLVERIRDSDAPIDGSGDSDALDEERPSEVIVEI